MKLIGITGKAGSGKDLLATYAWSEYAFSRIALADPLKLAAQQMFGLSEAQTWSSELKEVVIPHWGMSPRQMFQLLGTEASKHVFGNDVWCKRWLLSYDVLKDTDHIVCTDVRFDIEASMIRSLGGVILEIRRGGGLSGPLGSHVSEQGLSDAPDFVINNHGSIDDLHDAFDIVVSNLEC